MRAKGPPEPPPVIPPTLPPDFSDTPSKPLFRIAAASWLRRDPGQGRGNDATQPDPSPEKAANRPGHAARGPGTIGGGLAFSIVTPVFDEELFDAQFKNRTNCRRADNPIRRILAGPRTGRGQGRRKSRLLLAGATRLLDLSRREQPLWSSPSSAPGTPGLRRRRLTWPGRATKYADHPEMGGNGYRVRQRSACPGGFKFGPHCPALLASARGAPEGLGAPRYLMLASHRPGATDDTQNWKRWDRGASSSPAWRFRSKPHVNGECGKERTSCRTKLVRGLGRSQSAGWIRQAERCAEGLGVVANREEEGAGKLKAGCPADDSQQRRHGLGKRAPRSAWAEARRGGWALACWQPDGKRSVESRFVFPTLFPRCLSAAKTAFIRSDWMRDSYSATAASTWNVNLFA